MNGDGLADAVLFNPANGTWQSRLTGYDGTNLYLTYGPDVSGSTSYGTSAYIPFFGNVNPPPPHGTLLIVN